MLINYTLVLMVERNEQNRITESHVKQNYKRILDYKSFNIEVIKHFEPTNRDAGGPVVSLS